MWAIRESRWQDGPRGLQCHPDLPRRRLLPTRVVQLADGTRLPRPVVLANRADPQLCLTSDRLQLGRTPGKLRKADGRGVRVEIRRGGTPATRRPSPHACPCAHNRDSAAARSCANSRLGRAARPGESQTDSGWPRRLVLNEGAELRSLELSVPSHQAQAVGAVDQPRLCRQHHLVATKHSRGFGGRVVWPHAADGQGGLNHARNVRAIAETEVDRPRARGPVGNQDWTSSHSTHRSLSPRLSVRGCGPGFLGAAPLRVKERAHTRPSDLVDRSVSPSSGRTCPLCRGVRVLPPVRSDDLVARSRRGGFLWQTMSGSKFDRGSPIAKGPRSKPWVQSPSPKRPRPWLP